MSYDFKVYRKPWKEEKFVENLNEDVYHAEPAMSSGQIQTILDPDEGLHKLHAFKTAAVVRKETPALRFGRLFHKAVLEGEDFLRRFRVMPVFTGLTKDGRESTQSASAKAKRDAWLMDLPKDTILVDSLEERDQLSGMMKSLLEHPEAATLMRGGLRELSGFFNYMGFRFRIRIDLLQTENQLTIVDLKSSINAQMQPFHDQIVRQMYYVQAWIYMVGVSKIMGRPPTKFTFIAVDKEPPYLVGVHTVGESLLECGDRMTRKALSKMDAAIHSDQWLPEPQIEYTAEAPKWLMDKLAQE